jgi:hypothetical protein
MGQRGGRIKKDEDGRIPKGLLDVDGQWRRERRGGSSDQQ